jgi:hypothetical protein
MKKSIPVVLCTLLAQGLVAYAEEGVPRREKQRSAFRVEYTLYELDGTKRVNERSYVLSANDGASANLRIGTRLPISTPEKGVTYMNVGLKINGRVNEREDGDVTLDSDVEMTSLADQAEKRSGSPVLYDVSQGFSTRLTSGKPTLVASIDDVAGRKRTQVEVTLTRVK